MELNLDSGDSRKVSKKRPAPTDEPSVDGMVEVQMKRPKFRMAQEPSRKKLATQERGSGVSSGTSSSGASNAEIEKQANDLTLVKLQEYLNATEEDAIQHGLRVFIKRMSLDAKQREKSTTTKSLLDEYFASSPLFQEFFALWDFLQHRDRARTFIGAQLLDGIDAVLRFSGPDSPAASVFSRELLKKKLSALVSNLTSEFNAILISSLKVLKSIALQGPWQAREVFRNMNFGAKSTIRLMDRRQNQSDQQKKGGANRNSHEQDVRTHFVRLALAFMKSEDDTLIDEVLGMKNYLGGYFKGMSSDAVSVQREVLETIRDCVLFNPAISKRSKSLFFTASILDTLCSQLHGHLAGSDDDADDSDSDSFVNLLYSFLRELCGSMQHGILYKEPPTYVPPNAQNQAPSTHNPRVLSALHFLKPADHPSLSKLALAILTECPALKRLYVDKLKIGLDPRATLKWLANIRFMQRLIADVPLEVDYYISYLMNHSSDTWGGSDRVVSWIVPSILSRQILVSSVTHNDRAVSYAGILTCCDIMETSKSLLAKLSGKANAIQFSSLRNDLLQAFRKRLPDLQTMLNCLRKHEQSDTTQTKSENSLGDTSSLPVLDSVYKLLRFYVQLFPEAFVEARFDFGKLMNNFFRADAKESALSELVLLLSQASSALKWNASVGTQTQLSCLISAMMSPSRRSIASSIRDLVEKMLSQSGLFDGVNPIEIAIWLDCFENSAPSVLVSFEKLLVKSTQEPYVLAEAISTASQSLSLKSEFLPVSIPFMCALKYGEDLFNTAPCANFLHRVFVAACELAGALPVIKLVLSSKSPINDMQVLYRPFKGQASKASSGNINSIIEKISAQEPSEEELQTIYGCDRSELDSCLATLARVLTPEKPSILLHKLNVDLFLFKSVQTALNEQKKSSRESSEILKLLKALPLHSLIHQAFQLIHQALESPKDKLSLKMWSQVTDFVLGSLDAATDSLRALATIQLQISTLISTIEAAEVSGERINDDALQGINFGFQCLERVAALLARQGAAPSIIGSLDANQNLLNVFLAPSDVGIRISGLALTFFEAISGPLRDAGAVGFVSYVERLLSCLSSDSDVSESILKRAAAVFLPFIPPNAATTLYSAAFSQALDDEHWIWPILMQSVENGANTSSNAGAAKLPKHLELLLPAHLGELRFQPSYAICKRIFEFLMADSKALKNAGIERIALICLLQSLRSSSLQNEFNPFDLISQDILLHIINVENISTELSAIGALAVAVQYYKYDYQSLSVALCTRLARSLNISFLPLLLSFRQASRLHPDAGLLQMISKPNSVKWLLDASATSDVAAEILIDLLGVPSISSEIIAAQFHLWPAAGSKSSRPPQLSSGALRLVANSVLLGSNVDHKLVSIVMKEIFTSGILQARKSNQKSQVDYWLRLVHKGPNKLESLSSSDIKSIIRSLLKEGLRDAELLSISSSVLRGMNTSLRVETLKDLHDLLVSHPLFLDVLFGTANSTIGDAQGELAQFMLYMYTTAGKSIPLNEKLLKVYLGAYNASMTRSDRAILQILHHYEKHGGGLSAGMIWGPHARKAMVSEATMSKSQDDLEQQIESAQALFFDGKLIEAKRVSATLRRFPVLRQLNCDPEKDIDRFFDVPSSSRTPLNEIYDPAFVIPYFAMALRSFDIMRHNVKKFADIGGLSFTLMCLSCEDSALRQEAYNVLAMYDFALGPMQLSTDIASPLLADFREQPQLRQLLNSVKYAITSPNQRITSIVGSFLAQATFVAVRAEHPMYMNINEFLSSRAFLDVDTVPMFRQLFFSTDLVEFRRDREWLLRIIAHGVLQQQDLEQLQRRRALALLELHAASHAVSSDREQSYIWIILQNSILVDSQHEYTLNESILPWATQLVSAASVLPPHAVLKTLFNVSGLLHAICLLQDIEELCKSSFILLQLQSLASAMIVALKTVPLTIMDSTTDEEKKELVQNRLYTLKWLIEILVRFARGSQQQQTMLDVTIASHLIAELNHIEEIKIGDVEVPSIKHRLCDLVVSVDPQSAGLSPSLPMVLQGLISLAVGSLEAAESGPSRFLRALNWTLSVRAVSSSTSNIQWSAVGSSWRVALASLDQHTPDGLAAQQCVIALTHTDSSSRTTITVSNGDPDAMDVDLPSPSPAPATKSNSSKKKSPGKGKRTPKK